MELKHCTFIMACREFFGMKPGQSLQEFAKEVRELSLEERASYIEMLKTVGYDATKTA
jgi:hypothetical protein